MFVASIAKTSDPTERSASGSLARHPGSTGRVLAQQGLEQDPFCATRLQLARGSGQFLTLQGLDVKICEDIWGFRLSGVSQK